MKLKRIVSSLMALAVTASCLLATGISVEAESTVTGITLNETMGYFNVGTPLSFFTASVAPEGADAVELVWESDNPGIFTVDQQGVITGVSEGTATLTVRAGEALATATVHVVSNYSVDTNRQYENTEAEPKITQADTGRYTGNYNTANLAKINFTCTDDGWSWAYYAIALKDGSGEVKSVHLSAYENRQPNSIITKGGFSYYCYIPFTPGDFSIYRMYNNGGDFKINSVEFISSSVTGVTLNTDTLKLDVKPGSQNTAQLTATVEPTTAQDKSVTWSSTNPAVADVDQFGNVTAYSIGTTIIRATSNLNSMFSDECTVTVIDSTPESRKIAYIVTHGKDDQLYWPVNAYLPMHSAFVDVTEDNKEYTVSVTNTSQESVQLAQADLVILNAADENFELVAIKLNGEPVATTGWTQSTAEMRDNNEVKINSKVIIIPAETYNTWPPLEGGKSIEFVFKRASEEPNAYVKFNTGAGTNGAQVRLKTDGSKNEDLRFKFSYDVTDLPEEAKVSEYGFIYASGKNFDVSSVDADESLDLNTFTLSGIGSNPYVHNATAVNYRDEKVEEGRTVRYSNIVLTGIQDDELNIYYLARPYVTYTLGGETYTEYGGLIARSVYYVAKECCDKQMVVESDRKYLLERILNKVNAEEYPLT